MKDFEMSVYPTYHDEECTIIFSFHFRIGQKKLGEAVICTGALEYIEAQKKGLSMIDNKKDVKGNLETVAWLKQFAIVEEYKSLSMEKIADFIKLLGIKKFILEEPTKQSTGKIGHSTFKKGITLRQKQQPILFG